ncbi:MAG: helix-turn-helix transcriptional regulator [Sedimentisphaerales bacterium]|nr:helix-turn-helix transcriptional regulator [Sedimentisphaerales bacterium]
MTVTTHMQLCSEQEWARLQEHLHLPARQAEIARHIMSGKSDKQIARAMGISITTVRTHVSRVFRKFDLSDRGELMLHVFACLRQSDGVRDRDDGDSLP